MGGSQHTQNIQIKFLVKIKIFLFYGKNHMGFLANPILEKVGSLHDQMGNFSKDGNSNNQMEILEIKNMVIQLKISFVWLISSFETGGKNQ